MFFQLLDHDRRVCCQERRLLHSVSAAVLLEHKLYRAMDSSRFSESRKQQLPRLSFAIAQKHRNMSSRQHNPTKPLYTTPFRFLSLPPEIRNMIYRHVVSVSTRTGIMSFDEELRLFDSLGVHITDQFETQYRRSWCGTPYCELMRYETEIVFLCHQVGAEFMASQA